MPPSWSLSSVLTWLKPLLLLKKLPKLNLSAVELYPIFNPFPPNFIFPCARSRTATATIIMSRIGTAKTATIIAVVAVLASVALTLCPRMSSSVCALRPASCVWNDFTTGWPVLPDLLLPGVSCFLTVSSDDGVTTEITQMILVVSEGMP